ncbi:MAG: hypothetical protein LBH05_03830, partial [Deferribacteraceae bacterium]|nr:hypothetical protein [Deferribacteraceae bacterium]
AGPIISIPAETQKADSDNVTACQPDYFDTAIFNFSQRGAVCNAMPAVMKPLFNNDFSDLTHSKGVRLIVVIPFSFTGMLSAEI